MPKPQKAFISISFEHRGEFEKEIRVIKQVLKEVGFEPFCFVQDYKEKESSPQELMRKALERVGESRLLIAEVSYKEIGIGIEIGYAKALNIPIIYIRQKNAPISTTVKGVCEEEIVYETPKDLKIKLKKTLSFRVPMPV